MPTNYCKHCRRWRIINRPRGLCWDCYYTPGVKDQHPPVSKCGRKGVGGGVYGGYALPAEPTTAEPGSPEKIEVMGERAAARTQLHHPDDPRQDHAFLGAWDDKALARLMARLLEGVR